MKAEHLWGAAGAIEQKIHQDSSAQEALCRQNGRGRDHMIIAMALTIFHDELLNDGARRAIIQ